MQRDAVSCTRAAFDPRRLDVLTPDLGRGGSGRPTVLVGKSQHSGAPNFIPVTLQCKERDLIIFYKLAMLGVENLI